MVGDVNDKLHQDAEAGNEDVPGPDVVVTVGPEVPDLVPHPGRLHPDRRGEAGGPGQQVQQTRAVRSGQSQLLALDKLPAEEQAELVHAVDDDGSVCPGVVVGQSLKYVG